MTYADVADSLRALMQEPSNAPFTRDVVSIQRWLDKTEAVSGSLHALKTAQVLSLSLSLSLSLFALLN